MEAISHTAARPTKRFAVYRNNVVVSLVAAIRTRFPVVERIVGEEFFAATVRAFVTARPPRSPVIFRYGDDFPEFIESFPPAAELPYLADVARLEAARTRAYHAEDATPVDPAQFGSLAPAALAAARLSLHPSAEIVRSPHPIVTIWSMNSNAAEVEPIDDWKAEDALVVRPNYDVEVRRLPPGGAAFIAALGARRSLSEAADIAINSTPDFDLVANLAGLIGSGLVIGVGSAPA
jgi:hypothetical protein